MKTRTVKPPEERRQEIIATATRLFLAEGYDDTSMNDVMKALDVAKGTIYHYFSSKDELLEAVVDKLASDYAEHREELVKNTQGNALEKIRVLFSRTESAHDQEKYTHLHKTGNVKLHTWLLGALVEKLAPLFGTLIRQGCQEGLFHTSHPHEVAELLLAGIQALTDERFYHWEKDAISRRKQAFPQIIESMVRAEPGSLDFLFPSRHDGLSNHRQADRESGLEDSDR